MGLRWSWSHQERLRNVPVMVLAVKAQPRHGVVLALAVVHAREVNDQVRFQQLEAAVVVAAPSRLHKLWLVRLGVDNIGALTSTEGEDRREGCSLVRCSVAEVVFFLGGLKSPIFPVLALPTELWQ